VSPELLQPPVNALRVSLHPDGLARRIVNLAEYGGHLIARLQREVLLSGDPGLTALLEELRQYPGGGHGSGGGPVAEPAEVIPGLDPASLLFVPLVLEAADGAQLSFFSTLATFGTALDITLAELSIESFFPADKATEAALRAAFG
jgi:hypothetical protein